MANTSTIAELAPDVSARLQDPRNVFWNEQYEVFAAIAEAISELLLIIGRPTIIFNQPLTPAVNTCFNPMPAGLLCITNIRTPVSTLGKTSLRNLDYLCGSWSPSWQSERGATPKRWAPLGLNYFVLHPAPVQPIAINLTGISYPITTTWPPNGTELSVFQKEFDQALQLYAAAYCRQKEIGNDAAEGRALYQQFLEIGQRLSQIEDRKDSIVWTRGFGAATAPSQVAHR
jgi:hypothetical protein